MVRRDGLGAASAGDALDAFYSPRSVVVVGASRRPGKLGHDVMVEYARLGLAGAMYGVIPLADVEPVGGWPVVRSVGELPEVPALALVALGVLDTLAAVDELARAGVRAAVLAAAGLGELGGVAAQIEREIAGVARSAGMRLLGANGFGLFSGPARLNLTAWREVLAGKVALLTQSGNVAIALCRIWCARLSACRAVRGSATSSTWASPNCSSTTPDLPTPTRSRCMSKDCARRREGSTSRHSRGARRRASRSWSQKAGARGPAGVRLPPTSARWEGTAGCGTRRFVKAALREGGAS
jgi:hypothetical protein